ncbi:hypothetical protein LTR84_002697 [Exophiala bonariae]|uniref:Up-regulated during septation protein 1 domain-containing protein n=1 Tax=Exophiala bonariae TaxID=1690606 RepID=A0AAV9N8P7_9EURO|nr:hypothetical protein LTR84_002697 [Exophiala bonariae]
MATSSKTQKLCRHLKTVKHFFTKQVKRLVSKSKRARKTRLNFYSHSGGNSATSSPELSFVVERRGGILPPHLGSPTSSKAETLVEVTPNITTVPEQVNDDGYSESFGSFVVPTQRSKSTSSESFVSAPAGGNHEESNSHDQEITYPTTLSTINEESPQSSPQATPPRPSNGPAEQEEPRPSTTPLLDEHSDPPLSSFTSLHGEAVEISGEPETRGRSVQFHTRVITVSASPPSTASLDRSVTSVPRTHPRGQGRRGSGPLRPPAFDGTSVIDFDIEERPPSTGTPIITPLLTKLRRSNNSSIDSGHSSSSMSPKQEEHRGSIGSLKSIVSGLQKLTLSASQKSPTSENPPQLEDELPDTREGLEARLNYHLGELDLIRKMVRERNREIEQTSSRLYTHQRLRDDVQRCSLKKLDELSDSIRQQRNGLAQFVDYHRGEIRRIGQRREELDISQGIQPTTKELYKTFDKQAEWVQLFSE